MPVNKGSVKFALQAVIINGLLKAAFPLPMGGESCSNGAYDKTDGTAVCAIVMDQRGQSFDQAVRICKAIGASLPVIRSEWENSSLYSKMASAGIGTIWLYGSDRRNEGTFLWRDNPFDRVSSGFTKWHPLQPDNFQNNNHCMEMGSDSLWNDQDCHYRHNRIICEKPFYPSRGINQHHRPKFAPYRHPHHRPRWIFG